MSSSATVLQTSTQPKYCAVGLYLVGHSDPSLMMANGKVILFDTKAICQQVLPQLGEGRFSHWSKDGEQISFSPIVQQGFNRAMILTGYDPYHLPGGLPAHLRSETAGREWKHHIMWSHWMFDCDGNFVKRRDGSWANVALGEAV